MPVNSPNVINNQKKKKSENAAQRESITANQNMFNMQWCGAVFDTFFKELNRMFNRTVFIWNLLYHDKCHF